jgi:type IV secretory pathway protease TraF
MRIVVLATVLGGVVLTTVPAAMDWSPVLIWNASASAPIGLYRVQPEDHLAIPDLVVVMPPEPVAGFLAERGYLPHGVPLLKQVLALPGQTVHPSYHHDRWRRDGHGSRARSPETASARLARLPHDRRQRSLPHELAVRRFPRRPLFRCASRYRDTRPCGSTLDLRGPVTMQIFCRKPSVSLCDRERLHSYVPSKIDTFGCRSFDLRREPTTIVMRLKCEFANFLLQSKSRSKCDLAAVRAQSYRSFVRWPMLARMQPGRSRTMSWSVCFDARRIAIFLS